MQKRVTFGAILVCLFGVAWWLQKPVDAKRHLPDGDLQFADGGPIAVAVGKVVGKGRAVVAKQEIEGRRWVCVLVDETRRFAELDGGIRVEDAPMLVRQGFASPPGPILRTMSIYRSLTKKEMEYSREEGDRVAILLCPKAAWGKLELHWDGLLR